MSILLFIIIWVLLGALGSWFGWAVIDKRKYDLEMAPLLAMMVFGPFTLLVSILAYLSELKLLSRFSKIKVFKRKSK